MKLLVTGGAGFIGSNFIHYWLNHYPDDSIVNLDALTYAGHLENLSDLENNPHYCLIKGSITDSATVATAMQGCDTVVHFAAESHVDRSISSPDAFIQTNIYGTYVLLEQARKQGVSRFHHVSTDEVFGSLPLEGEEKFSETTPYAPNSPYSASKASSDLLVRSYFHTYGLPVTISNCSNNYGPYQHPEKLIPVMVLAALNDKRLPVYGNGKNIRDWIQVTDHNRAVELILKKGKIGESYCIGGEAEVANIDLVKIILKALDKPKSLIEYVSDRLGHDLRYAIDMSKIKTELGYVPQYTFERGIEETVEWYVNHQEWCRHVTKQV